MDRKAFFAHLRKRDVGIFGTSLSQAQVDATEALLDEMDGWPLAHVAHVLAEVYHETGGGMAPVKETVFRHSKDQNPPDAQVIRRLDNAWAKGQLPWVSKPYWRDGWFGRGQIQITHKDNYIKASDLTGVDLVKYPQKALRLPISAKIAAVGCRTGMFTGKKLSDFDGPEYDHYNARAIVNGDKRKNGIKITGHAKEFEAALAAGDWGVKAPAPDYAPEPPTQPSKAPSGGKGGLWGSIAALVAAGGAAVAAKGCEWLGWFCG